MGHDVGGGDARSHLELGGRPSRADGTARARVTALGGVPFYETRMLVDVRDLKVTVRAHKSGHLVILCVDTSASMGVEQRMKLAKGLRWAC